MDPSPLVTTDWLAAHLDDASVSVVEVFAAQAGLAPGTRHVPGAAGLFWKDLCWHDSDREFVDGATLARRLAAAGVGAGDTVVLVGDPVQFGTYAFWAMTMAGHPKLRLLDGARTKWLAEGRPTAAGTPANSVESRPDNAERAFERGDSSMRIGRDEVRAGLGRAGRCLLDVRSPEEYSGERVMAYGSFDHGAERAGRIPGAKHLFFRDLVNADDTFKAPGEIRAALAAAGADPAAFEDLVIYCRLSHRASLAWFAITYLMGEANALIYDGSWTEWGSIVGFPVER